MGIGEDLRSLRKDMRISREELEMLSGVSVATIKRLESGFGSVALDNVLAIAAALRARVEVRSENADRCPAHPEPLGMVVETEGDGGTGVLFDRPGPEAD